MRRRATIALVLALAAASGSWGCAGGGGSGGAGSTSGGGSGGTSGGTTGGGTTTGGGSGGQGAVGQVFPSDNPWNTDISSYPVHPSSATYIRSMGPSIGLHPDFGTVWQGAPNGISYDVVGAGQTMVTIHLRAYASESDPGPYPVPRTAQIEGGPSSNGDRHVIVVDTANRMLYEMFRAFPNSDGSWNCDSGAVYDLTSNALRPMYWTSADAAGLPIFPGLVRYDEAVTAGAINHALRFTVSSTQDGFISPARHQAGSANTALPPMGLRVRLKAGFDITPYPAEVQVILRALKRYGMIVADNGSDWYLGGAPDSRWDNDDLHQLGRLKGSDFEVVSEASPRA